MKFIKDELYKYDNSMRSLWDGVIVTPITNIGHKSFASFRVVEGTERFLSAGGRIGEIYSLSCQYITPLEPQYLQYDPSQQADLDDDI